MSESSRFISQLPKSQSDEQPLSNTQQVTESGGSMMSKKPVKRRRLGKKEFTRDYVRNSILFGFGEPTKEDINRTYILVKNDGKKKRVKPKSEPEMTREEHIATNIRNHTIFFGEQLKEEDLNREWDIYQIGLQYRAIRGRTKKEKEEKQQAFMERMGQEIKARYSPEAIEERRLQKEAEMNKHNIK
jgi:hypothetical protein